ncbi:14-3-3 protein [Aphanomyces cochlioides]|nr:14-3-3 protein [Aphanomyces cochlioides]
MALDRGTLVFLASLAAQAERFHESVGYMTTVVTDFEPILTDDERVLLAMSFKNVLDARRTASRSMLAMEAKFDDKSVQHAVHYRLKIEAEAIALCEKLAHLIDPPQARDNYRYMAELQAGDARKASAAQALESYEKAFALASTTLQPSDTLRLILALNFSVFYHDILDSPERASHLAKQAFDDAVAQLDSLSPEDVKASMLALRALRENVVFWTRDDRTS